MEDLIKQLIQDLHFCIDEYPLSNQEGFVQGAIEILKSLDASNGNTHYGVDEGNVLMRDMINQRIDQWRELENTVDWGEVEDLNEEYPSGQAFLRETQENVDKVWKENNEI